MPIYAIYIQKISPKISHIGGVWGFHIITAGILVFLISRFENNLKYADYFLIGGFLFRAFGWIGYIFANQIWQIYAIQILLAMGVAFGSPSYGFLYSKYLDRGYFASEWGLNLSINSFIIGGAAILGSLIVENYGFEVIFISMIALSLISTILALKYRKDLGAKDFFSRKHKKKRILKK